MLLYTTGQGAVRGQPILIYYYSISIVYSLPEVILKNNSRQILLTYVIRQNEQEPQAPQSYIFTPGSEIILRQANAYLTVGPSHGLTGAHRLRDDGAVMGPEAT